jgi:hypothetical protein
MNLTERERAVVLLGLALVRDWSEDSPMALVQRPELVGQAPYAPDELTRLFERLRRPDQPDDEAKITRVLQDGDDLCVEVGDTINDVYNQANRVINQSTGAPIALFQVEGDERWWCATIELDVGKASDAYVADCLDEQKDAEEEEDEEDEADGA